MTPKLKKKTTGKIPVVKFKTWILPRLARSLH
jgi:hypothetical protein